MEVVLAVVLFVSSALVVLAGLNAALRTAQRVQLEAQAADLAVSVLSHIQMGLLPPADDGPNEFEDDQTLIGWTWEIVTEPLEEESIELEMPQFNRVEVIIRNEGAGVTYRLVQWMAEEAQEEAFFGQEEG
jgi:hypothetical protein